MGAIYGDSIEPLSIYSEKAQKTIRALNKTGAIIQPLTFEANFLPGFSSPMGTEPTDANERQPLMHAATRAR